MPVATETAALLEGIEEPAVLLSPDYRIVAANQAYSSRFGDGGDISSRHCYEVSHHFTKPCDLAGETCPLKNCLQSGEPQRVLHLHFTSTGTEHVDINLIPIRNADGSIVYLLEKMCQIQAASSRPVAEGLVGQGPQFNRMLELVLRVSTSNTAVLLQGESGTGKELVARAIHENSPRSNGPFVAVECSGLSETLFESELFGHEKGAFTSAQTRKTGLVEAANGGTLFLDEIGDIPSSQQVKLLRLLEQGTFRRVGGVEPLRADFRLVLATHRSLRKMVDEGVFRQDLFYRISTFPVLLPPLRERREDLGLLIHSLLQRLDPERPRSISEDAMRCLSEYAFPGNIRELRNILERACLLADGSTLFPEHLPTECVSGLQAVEADRSSEILSLEENEQRYLARVLESYIGDRESLAGKLGISRRTLYRKINALADKR